MVLVLHKSVDVVSSQHRLLIEGDPILAVCVKQLHIDPCTDRLHLSVLLNHVHLVRTGSTLQVTHGNIRVTAIDYVIVISYLQIGTSPILPILWVVNLAEVDNGAYRIANETRRIDQVATTFVQDDVTLSNVLQRPKNAPIGIKGILCHGICVTLTVGGEHVLARRRERTKHHAQQQHAYN